ncbi:putative assembly chaperone of rpl4 [Taenia solium]|eukprot:TsM_000544300 transcript=TsM_000544300 gene=TsM_000544300
MGRRTTEDSNESSTVTSSTGSANQCQSPRDLIAQAAEKVNSFQYNQALRLYKSALSLLDQLQASEENRGLTIEALQSSAFLLLDEGEFEEAKENLLKAVQLSPNEGYEKYMYLAQISGGSEAVDLYRKGIGIMNRSLEGTDGAASSPKDKLRRALSNAYCAISDLYTTDLCDEPEAESSCREAIEKATETDESNPQAWFCAANLLTIKAQDDEAKQALEKCLSLYWPQVEQVVSVLRSRENGGGGATGDNEEVEELDLEEISGIPYEAHIQMVKMMMELDMFERAAEVLEAMLEEDDEHVEVLYLLTIVGEELWINSNPDRLRYYAEITKELCANNGDVEMVREMEELLTTLPQNDEDSGKEEGGDEDTEISSSSEDEEDVMDSLEKTCQNKVRLELVSDNSLINPTVFTKPITRATKFL